MTTVAISGGRSICEVLGAGWDLFIAGLSSVFPWVLAAELVQLLPFANRQGGLFDTDLSLFAQPGYLVRALVFGGIQALLYGIAVLRLPMLVEGSTQQTGLVGRALRAVPAVFVGYVCYEFIVAFGLVLAFAAFMIGLLSIGALAGLVLCILPLAPTAAASTALALFIFPAVLEGRGPFAALNESSRLAKTSWVRVSLVISVPAMALLAAAVLVDFQSLSHTISSALELMQRTQDGSLSTEEQVGLLESLKAAPTASRYSNWQIMSTVLGAFAWWYTLAVCYAQYRDLKAQKG